DEAAFQRIYQERIEPCFRENEGARLEAVALFNKRAMIVAGVGLVLGAAVYIGTREFGWVFAALIGALVMIGFWAYAPLAKVGEELKRQYCTGIAAAMGASYHIVPLSTPAFERMRALRLAPGFDRSKFEDHFHGAYKGAAFDLYEAHLEKRRTDSKGRTRYDTVFRGQLMRMHFPRDFLGVTIVRRDAGVFNAFGGGEAGGRKLERVRLVDSKFEKAFEVWGTDQVEARYLLHPVMMERLIELETRLHGKRIRCAFEGGDLLVAVEGGDLFEPGDLFKPLVNPARAKRIVDEISGVFKVMDQVLTAGSARPL
ncbi:MAG TPA: DUF3137 domain-containing protein, partial [Terricaulis sp.]|nr:DUF3137 domain-containing protein [Terricaulis sp.]